jgi:hypothetical protein
MWYEDLTECDYIGYETPLIAIGWLEKGKIFSTGITPEKIYFKLCGFDWNDGSYVSHRGFHQCDLCDFQFYGGEATSSSVFLLPGNGKIYAYPALITHYINTHFYRPPKEFIEAVSLCPPMLSMEYWKKMQENGGEELYEFWKTIKEYMSESENK